MSASFLGFEWSFDDLQDVMGFENIRAGARPSEKQKPEKTKPRLSWKPGFCNGEPDDVLLSLEIQPTIIGDKVFHCPVRNGKEWDHLSMVIRQRLCCASSEFFTWSETKLSCDSLTQKFS